MRNLVRDTQLHYVPTLIDWVAENKKQTASGWTVFRPVGQTGFFHRLRLAWGVFTGRYDALRWPTE